MTGALTFFKVINHEQHEGVDFERQSRIHRPNATVHRIPSSGCFVLFVVKECLSCANAPPAGFAGVTLFG
jgi:hypothetical protein